MPTLISGQELRTAVEQGTLIEDGNPDRAEGVKYDLTLGDMLLMAGSGPINISQLSEVERAKLAVQPGEMVFALTRERLNLGQDVMAQLSPKRSVSHAGIMIVGGFCIDPNYHGNLLLGLYNLSSTPFRLTRNLAIIAATFYRLDRSEVGPFPTPAAVTTFPADVIQTMEKYKPEGSQALTDMIRRVEADLSKVWIEVNRHTRFEEALERHDKQIERLVTGLETEAHTRQQGEDRLTQNLRRFERSFYWLAGAAALVALVVTAIVLPLVLDVLKAGIASRQGAPVAPAAIASPAPPPALPPVRPSPVP